MSKKKYRIVFYIRGTEGHGWDLDEDGSFWQAIHTETKTFKSYAAARQYTVGAEGKYKADRTIILPLLSLGT